MRITFNQNGSLNLFGISRTKAQSLLKAFYVLLSKKPHGELPVLDMFDLKMLDELLTDLEKLKDQISHVRTV